MKTALTIGLISVLALPFIAVATIVIVMFVARDDATSDQITEKIITMSQSSDGIIAASRIGARVCFHPLIYVPAEGALSAGIDVTYHFDPFLLGDNPYWMLVVEHAARGEADAYAIEHARILWDFPEDTVPVRDLTACPEYFEISNEKDPQSLGGRRYRLVDHWVEDAANGTIR